MRRRDFLWCSGGLALTALQRAYGAPAQPCPPPEISVSGGGALAATCGPSKVPQWWSDLPESTWVGLAGGDGANGGISFDHDWQRGDTLNRAWAASSPKPSQGSIEPANSAYSGWTVNQARREFVAWGGGHGNHVGNAPYLLNLASDKPGWVIGGATSPGSIKALSPLFGEVGSGRFSSNPYLNNDGQYVGDAGANGAPATPHAYKNTLFIGDDLWVLGLGGQGRAGTNAVTSSSMVFSWSRSTMQWTKRGKFFPDEFFEPAAYPGEFLTERSACYVPDRKEIWRTVKTNAVASAAALVRLSDLDAPNPKPTYWTFGQGVETYDGTAMIAFWSAMHDRYLIAIADGSDGAPRKERLRVLDPANPLPIKTVNYVNSFGFPLLRQGQNGLQYSRALNALLLPYLGGPDVYYLKVPENPLTGTWTVRRFTGAGSPDITNGAGNNIYTRWNIIDEMGDGRSAVVFNTNGPNASPHVYRPTWVMKLPRSLS